VSKATSLFFHLVLAWESLQPKSAKFGFHLLLPWTFIEVLPFKRATFIHARALSMFDWLTLTDLLRAYRRHELRNSVKRRFFSIRVAEAICRWSCGWSSLRSSLVMYMLALGEFKVKHWDMFMVKALSWHFWRSCEILNTFGWDIDWDSHLLIRRGLESALSAECVFISLSKWVLRGCCVLTGWSLSRLEYWTLLLSKLHVLTLETLRRLVHIGILFTLVIEEWLGTLVVHKAWHWCFALKRFAVWKAFLKLIALYVHLVRWDKWFDISHAWSSACNFLKCWWSCHLVLLAEIILLKLTLRDKRILLSVAGSWDKDIASFAKVSEVKIGMWSLRDLCHLFTNFDLLSKWVWLILYYNWEFQNLYKSQGQREIIYANLIRNSIL